MTMAATTTAQGCNPLSSADASDAKKIKLIYHATGMYEPTTMCSSNAMYFEHKLMC